MTLRPADWTVDNGAYAAALPRLSVLIPFFRDDPSPLLRALEVQAGGLPIEIVVLDDGFGDKRVSASAAEAVMAMRAPARLIRLAANEGRAKGRNRLMAAARAGHLLFLDADMLPDDDQFLARWLALIEAEDPAVAFGGFTLDRTPDDPAHGLHRALSLRGDCRPAALRQSEPAKSLCTSNLLVRREVFAVEPFDEGFQGWGWEDVEWAIRVGRRWGVRHIDNTASHLGLDTDAALVAKYEQSRANFARMVAAHPAETAAFPVRRAARRLAMLPLRSLWRPMLKRIALARLAPLLARTLALKLYRAALYAEAG